MSSTVPTSSPSSAVSDGSIGGVNHLLGNVVTAQTPPPVPPGRHCGTSKGTCTRQDCNRVLPSFSNDAPHSVCITCRGFCATALRYEECANWDVVVMEGARSYQCKLAQCHSKVLTLNGRGALVLLGISMEVGMIPVRSWSLGMSTHSSWLIPSPYRTWPLRLIMRFRWRVSLPLFTHGSLLQSMLSEMISP